MWNLIQHTLYFLKFSQNQRYDICVTDFKNIWSAAYSKSELLLLLKDSNPKLEIRDDGLIQKGVDMLLNPQKLKNVSIHEIKEDNILIINMKMSFEHPLKLRLTLKGSSELFYKEVTMPLIRIIQDLQASQEELCNCLKKKDYEIEKYKLEGVEIPRCFKTVKFNDEVHIDKYKMYKEYFGSSTIPKSFLEEGVNVPEKITIKQEFINGDTSKTEIGKIETKTRENSVSQIKSMPTVVEPMNIKKELKIESNTTMDIPSKKLKKGKKFSL